MAIKKYRKDFLVNFFLRQHSENNWNIYLIHRVTVIMSFISFLLIIRGIYLTTVQNNYSLCFPFVTFIFAFLVILCKFLNIDNYLELSFLNSIIRQLIHHDRMHILGNIEGYLIFAGIESLLVNKYGYINTIITLTIINILWIILNSLETYFSQRINGVISYGYSGVVFSSFVFICLTLFYQFNWHRQFFFFGIAVLLYGVIQMLNAILSQAVMIIQNVDLFEEINVSNIGHIFGQLVGVFTYCIYHLIQENKGIQFQKVKDPVFKPETAIWNKMQSKKQSKEQRKQSKEQSKEQRKNKKNI